MVVEDLITCYYLRVIIRVIRVIRVIRAIRVIRVILHDL